ncbi:MAG: carotenoid oxygenase family protein, partial [Lysobacterales bacterium]
GKAMSLFYMNGEGYRLDPLTLETLGIESWVPIDGISAHAKVNENTGELYFFNYTVYPPFAHYGVVDKDNQLMAYRPVALPGPRVIHDMAFTENYAILPDFPLLFNAQGQVEMHWELPSRFGFVPRNGGPGEVRWFEAKPTFVQHWLNAYEEGDWVILDGYLQEDPVPQELPRDYPAEVAAAFAILHSGGIRTILYRWRFNLVTGETREECIDDLHRTNLEFGMFNQRYGGRKYRYAYSATLEPDMFLMNGWVKHDLQTGESWARKLPAGLYCSESPFAPRKGSKDEDDGYLISFITDENQQQAECWIIDAKRIQDGPVARIALPHKVKSGTHSTWASRQQLTGQ